MRNLPSLRQLNYLTVLAEEEHFGRAAKRCFVTQSTMSAAIRELEETLGVKLFERTKRSVMLTPMGRRITDAASDILLRAEDLMDMAEADTEPLSGALHLGAIPTIGPYLLPGAMRLLGKTYPKLNLYLIEEQTETLLQNLRKGDLDVALIALPFDMTGLTAYSLGQDKFQLAVPGGHELLKQKTVKIEEIDPEMLLLLGEGHCLKTHALSACNLATGELRQTFQATSLGTLIEMVNAGLGITLLPEMAIRAGVLRGTTIKTLPIRNANEFRDIALVWRTTSARVEEFSLLGDVLQKAMG